MHSVTDLASLDDPQGVLGVVVTLLEVLSHLLDDRVLDEADQPREAEPVCQLDQGHAVRGAHALGDLSGFVGNVLKASRQQIGQVGSNQFTLGLEQLYGFTYELIRYLFSHHN